MTKQQTPTIVGLHIAKTGGTSVLAHFTDELGKEVCWSYGANSAVRNFFAGGKLFEELDPAERAAQRFVFGHGVKESTLWALDDPHAALFCVLRDPYAHFISHYKHRKRRLVRHGDALSPRQFLENRRINPFALSLTERFPALAGDPTLDLETRARNVLKHFRFVMQTEHLNEQSAHLCSFAGIPPIARRNRVYPEAFDPQGVTADEIYETNAIDNRLYQEIGGTESAGDGAHATFNAFGFDEAATRDLFADLQQASDRDELRERARDALVAALERFDRLDAAHAYLRLGGMATPETAERLKREPEAGAERTAAAAYHLGVVLKRHGDAAAARARLEEAIGKNSQLTNAHVALARLCFDEGDAETAQKHAAIAVSLNDKQVPAHLLLGRMAHLAGRPAEAITHMERALKWAPKHPGANRILKASRAKLARTAGG